MAICQPMRTAWCVQGSREYELAWEALKTTAGDYAEENDGECWQYMGSVFRCGEWRHTFRHRNRPRNATHLPSTHGRVYIDIPATDGWEPQISRTA